MKHDISPWTAMLRKPKSSHQLRALVIRSAMLAAWALILVGLATPVQAQRVHSGFWIGFGPGGVTAAGKEGLSYPLYMRLGATVNQHLLLGVESYNVIVNYYGGKLFGSVAAIALLYPPATGGLFIKPGLGLSYAQANCCGTTSGLAAILGVGYDLRLGRNIYLTPNLDLLLTTHDRPGENPFTGAAAFYDTNPTFSFALGVTWHQQPHSSASGMNDVLPVQPPNMRLKLTGAYRRNGIGVFAPWRARPRGQHYWADERVARSLSAIRQAAPSVTHHPGIHSPRHLLDKLRRELDRLEREMSPYDFANFVINAHSICDWIENDPSVPASAQSALPAMRARPELQVCRDLANGTKHFQLNYPNSVVVDATCISAFGEGRFGAGPYGVGEPVVQITMADGSTTDGLDVARKVGQEWQLFFATHNM